MGKSELEAPLLIDEGNESEVNARISRVNDDYVAVPESSSGGAIVPEDPEALWGSSAAQLRSKTNRVAVIAICCVAAVLFLSAGFVSYSSRLVQNLDDVVLQHDDAVFNERHGSSMLAQPDDQWGPENDDAEDKEEDFYSASMTSFHFRPDSNFMSDPNAPMHYKGYYHFFYQYNPCGSVWGNITWGHAVSKDFLNWQVLDSILEPDQWYDYMGTWSGSSTILKDGTPIILYTGGRDDFGSMAKQSTNMAYPVDPTDPFLRNWKKAESNPLMLNPSFVRPQDFRDPTTAWLEDDGIYRLAVGSRKTGPDGSLDGVALMYTSTDFFNWELQDTLLHHHYNTGMWECVDLFPVLVESRKGIDHSILRSEVREKLQAEHYYSGPYKYVLKASLDDYRHDHYAVGTYSTETHTFTPDDPNIDTGAGLRYDYGKFYASKTFFDPVKNRRILWGYCNESDSELDDVKKHWSSVQAIPRTIWLDPLDQLYIRQWPVEELETLRGAKKSMQNVLLQPADVVPVKGISGAQLDILVAFKKPDVSTQDDAPLDAKEFDCAMGAGHRGVFGPFGMLVEADDNLVEQTAIFFYIGKLADGRWAYRACSDQSRSTKSHPGIDNTNYGTQFKIQEYDEELHIRILVDHSIVESFVQYGKVVITARVYPTIAIGSKAKIFLFNNGTTPIEMTSLDVYRMGSINMGAQLVT